MRKRWSINVFKVLDLSLANTFKMYMHSYKNGLRRKKVVKQCDGSCFREDVDVQSIPPNVLVLSVLALQPCGQIYHIICAASRRPSSLQTQTLNLWVPPSLFRPPHCCRLGKPSADRFTVLSISWTQERVQPHRVTLQNYSPPLWKLNNLLYGHHCERSSKCTVTVKGDMNRTAALSRFIAAQSP